MVIEGQGIVEPEKPDDSEEGDPEDEDKSPEPENDTVTEPVEPPIVAHGGAASVEPETSDAD